MASRGRALWVATAWLQFLQGACVMRWTAGGQVDHQSFAGLRGKGGGSSTSSGYSTQSTQLPDWITGPAQQAIQQATALSQRPTQVNPYETVATPTADTQQAYQQIRNMQGQGDPNYAAATQGYLNLAPLAQGITPQQLTQNTQSLLNPYTSAVIDPAVTQMRQGLANNLATIGK